MLEDLLGVDRVTAGTPEDLRGVLRAAVARELVFRGVVLVAAGVPVERRGVVRAVDALGLDRRGVLRVAAGVLAERWGVVRAVVALGLDRRGVVRVAAGLLVERRGVVRAVVALGLDRRGVVRVAAGVFEERCGVALPAPDVGRCGLRLPVFTSAGLSGFDRGVRETCAGVLADPCLVGLSVRAGCLPLSLACVCVRGARACVRAWGSADWGRSRDCRCARRGVVFARGVPRVTALPSLVAGRVRRPAAVPLCVRPFGPPSPSKRPPSTPPPRLPPRLPPSRPPR